MNAVLNAQSTQAAPATTGWTLVCPVDDIVPNTGVCALVGERPVAVFRVKAADGSDQFHAIDNIDPKNGANVLSRGLVGNLGEHIVVAGKQDVHGRYVLILAPLAYRLHQQGPRSVIARHQARARHGGEGHGHQGLGVVGQAVLGMGVGPGRSTNWNRSAR